METLGYTTSIVSWPFIMSAIEMSCNSKSEIKKIDYNKEAISCVVLSCVSLEAFTNEISSITNAFINHVKRDFDIDNLPDKQKFKIGIDLKICEDISQIRNAKEGSFYKRFKKLLLCLKIEKPEFFQKLHHLQELRNALVHFRLCDISVVEDTDGVIKYYQEPPEVFQHIKSYKVKGWPVIASDVGDNIGWNSRISTNAMAAWSIKLILNAIMHVLYNLPEGEYRDFLLKYYKSRENSNLFEKGKYNVEEWENKIFKK